MKVLLISYVFPPSRSVAARRWAKFSKYLCRKGVEVHVICADLKETREGFWDNDVEDIYVHRIPAKYLQVFLKQPKTLLGRAWFKLLNYVLNIFAKGTIFDRALFWGPSLKSKACEIIKKHNIKNVIATGAPFRSLCYACDLKDHFSGLNVIVDFRDPWTWGSAYGIPELSKKKYQYEKSLEESVVGRADIVIVPYPKMKWHLEKNYPKHANKLCILSHAVDLDDIELNSLSQIQTIENQSQKAQKIVWVGTMYEGIREQATEMLEAIKNSELLLSIDVYTQSHNFKDIFEKYSRYINVCEGLSSKKLLSKYQEYNYILLNYPNRLKDFLPTKVFETIATRVPIILVCSEGVLSNYITQNNLGTWIQPYDIAVKFPDILTSKMNHETFNSAFDITPHTFDHLTEQLIKLLK